MPSFLLFLLILAFFCLGYLLRRGIIVSTGKFGEWSVARRLERLPKDDYHVFNDVTLPTPKGTSQIDHLVVSRYGLFVIETKNYKGWIYGGENSEQWTQNIYGKKYSLYNPILQNAGHVRALRRVLAEFGEVPIIPIVAFSKRGSVSVRSDEAHVVYWSDIKLVIGQYGEPKLSPETVDAICKKIESKRFDSTQETAQMHRQNARRAKEQKNEAIDSGRCPRCGGRLVLREGRYGRFWGCSNYPRCRFTIQGE